MNVAKLTTFSDDVKLLNDKKVYWDSSSDPILMEILQQ